VPAANTPYQRSLGAVFRPILDLPDDARIGIALAYRADTENPALKRFLEITVEKNEGMAMPVAGPAGTAARSAA